VIGNSIGVVQRVKGFFILNQNKPFYNKIKGKKAWIFEASKFKGLAYQCFLSHI
jgi:hypothetical protein